MLINGMTLRTTNDINMNKIRTWIVLISPVFIIILGNFAARLFIDLLGNWAWIGYFTVYWGLLLLFIAYAGKWENQKLWFRKPQGSRWWSVFAVAIGFISFPALLIPNIHVMNSVFLVLCWCCFALLNSPIEEAYWRGFLLDETVRFPRAYGVIYSSVLFTLIHPLNLGLFSKIQAYDPGRPIFIIPFLVILILLSLGWSLLYLKTKSLKLSILSHILTDLGNLSVFLFMNMVQI